MTKGLLDLMDAAIGKASLSLLAGRPPKKAGRRQTERKCSQLSNHFRRARAPRPLLAGFLHRRPFIDKTAIPCYNKNEQC